MICTQMILSPALVVTWRLVVVAVANLGRVEGSDTATLGMPEMVPFLIGKVTAFMVMVPILIGPTLMLQDCALLASPLHFMRETPPTPVMVMSNWPSGTSSSRVPVPLI